MEVTVKILHSRKLVGCFNKTIFYICICFIFTTLLQGSDCLDEKYLQEYNETVDYSPYIFQKFDEILKFFLREENREIPHVKSAINIFRDECTKYKVKPPMSGRRKPFIVIEALHRSTRLNLARKLATLLRATMLQNPPKCLMNLKYKFDYGPLKRAYHALSLYASGFIARRIVSHYPVVMNGYWFDQTSFSVAKTFSNYSLPPNGSKLYDWPKDLVPPDIIFFIANEHEIYRSSFFRDTTTTPDSVMVKMLEVCRRMRGVPVVELNTMVSLDYTLDQIKEIIEKRFSNMFDFYFNDNIDK